MVKVLNIIPNLTGVGKYRMIDRYNYIFNNLSERVEIKYVMAEGFAVNPYCCKGYDVIHIHETSCAYLDGFMLIKKHNPTAKVIVDIDDYWVCIKELQQYTNYVTDGLNKKTLYALQNADYVTTTTEYFRQELLKQNKNVIVIKNVINENENQVKTTKTKDKRLRVGILCSSAHYADVKLLQGMVNILKPEIDKIRFVVCGFDLNHTITYTDAQGNTRQRLATFEENLWGDFERILTDNYSIVSPEYKDYLSKMVQQPYPYESLEPYSRRWTKDIDNYLTHYDYLDVLLVPLVDTKPCHFKSELKLVEAGYKNTAVICQDLTPYSSVAKGKDIAILMDKKSKAKDWAKEVKKLLNNPERVTELQENLSVFIKENYKMSIEAEKIVDIYEKIIL